MGSYEIGVLAVGSHESCASIKVEEVGFVRDGLWLDERVSFGLMECCCRMRGGG